MPDWVWDRAKDLASRRKHDGLSLADGVPALNDPFAVSIPDPHPDNDRWRTIGFAGGKVLLIVVHTELVEQRDGGGLGRNISVRKAERRERRIYIEQNTWRSPRRKS